MFEDSEEVYALVKGFVKKYHHDDYVIDDGERVKYIAQRWYQQNPEAASRNAKEWRLKNPDKWKMINKANVNNRRKAPGKHSARDIRELYASQLGKCAYCGIELNGKFHLDHVLPLSRGGSNNIDNLACACQKCNLSKSNKTIEEWKIALDKKYK